MTRNISIKNPTQKMIRLFDIMRDKKLHQIKKLSEKKQGIFTVIV